MIPGISNILEIGSRIIDRIIPDKQAQDAAKLKLLELQQQGELAKDNIALEQNKLDASLQQGQIDVNKIEAQSDSFWKSGWRPAVGWICVASLAYDYILRPLLGSFLAQYGLVFADLNTSELYPLLFGMLGFGALRTVEKIKKLK